MTPRVDVHPTSIASMSVDASVTQPINHDNVSRETGHQLEPALSGGVDPRTMGTRTNLVHDEHSSQHPRFQSRPQLRERPRDVDVPDRITIDSSTYSPHPNSRRIHKSSASTGQPHRPRARRTTCESNRWTAVPGALRPVSPNREHRASRSAPLMTTSAPLAWMACRGWSQLETPAGDAIPAIRLPWMDPASMDRRHLVECDSRLSQLSQVAPLRDSHDIMERATGRALLSGLHR